MQLYIRPFLQLVDGLMAAGFAVHHLVNSTAIKPYEGLLARQLNLRINGERVQLHPRPVGRGHQLDQGQMSAPPIENGFLLRRTSNYGVKPEN
ncbi:hypothetical protein [Paraburkholderia sp. GAS348]|uniref:hypothetical protein n=1 Tax=Paraburkholderia sp. GAS348 TaxID=3035132 RepID=UPI003D2389BE